MTYKQLGNGGAFDFDQCNSSFLIENNDKYLLFDCGHSVFAELRKQDLDINNTVDLSKLTSVYVSHMDDDHIGSLKRLIYYMYFAKGVKLEILYPVDIGEAFTNYLSDIDSVTEDVTKVPKLLFNLIGISSDNSLVVNGLSICLANTDHVKSCFGLIMVDGQEALYITGKTRASVEIRNTIDNLHNIYPHVVVFHDYSELDCPDNQVHACLSDTTKLYSDTTRSRYTKYNTGQPFDGQWKQLILDKRAK